MYHGTCNVSCAQQSKQREFQIFTFNILFSICTFFVRFHWQRTHEASKFIFTKRKIQKKSFLWIFSCIKNQQYFFFLIKCAQNSFRFYLSTEFFLIADRNWYQNENEYLMENCFWRNRCISALACALCSHVSFL